MEYPETINNFPITNHLEEICKTLKNSKTRSLILTAETGVGKSTVLPLALLKNFQGKILMTEPRRISVLGVANRVSSLLEQPVGQEVGYQIHLENKISSKTRLEVITEAILVKMLQQDQSLEGYNLVILDEFHERSIQLDLALAFLKEAMLLRDDLFVIIMSATIDSKKIANFMAQDFNSECPILKIPGKTYPVEIFYEENSKIENVALRESEIGKTVLVFLPGISDIRKCVDAIKEKSSEDIEILALHSSISFDEQKKVLQPVRHDKARIIVSSAIAETSITIPDVAVVIDSGLSRINRLDIATGMEGLFTEVESEFSAEQRCGRAGRTAKGKCIRLWNEFDLRKKNQEPEILRSDLINLVLECCERGIYETGKIQWLDSPTESSWKKSCELLKVISCIDENNRITVKGKKVLQLGLNARLGSILLAGASAEYILQFTNYAGSPKEVQKRFVADLNKRLANLKVDSVELIKESTEFSNYLLEGFPDRVAKKVEEKIDSVVYQFWVGKKASIKKEIIYKSLNGRQNLPEWIIATDVKFGETQAIIHDFSVLNGAEINKFIENKTNSEEKSTFLNGKIQKHKNTYFGKILLKSVIMPVSEQDLAGAWINEVLEKGLECLPIDEKTENLILRWEFCIQQGIIQTENGRQNVIQNVDKWLLLFLNGSSKLSEQIVYDALYWFLEGEKVDKFAPTNLILSTGVKVKLNYEKLASPEDKNKLVIRPVIEVIIQRIFGCFETPKVCNMKVLLRLLSPARRPLQITDDLESFWTGAWVEICKEMKGRYPKHNWDYKVVQKE